MRRTTRSLRFLTLGLALAGTACRSTTAHADGLTAAKSETAATSEAGNAGGAFGTAGGSDNSQEPARAAVAPHEQNTPSSDLQPSSLETKLAATTKPARSLKSGPPKPPSPMDPNMIAKGLVRTGFGRPVGWTIPSESVAVVSTEAMEPAVGDALREDLVILDKLLREAVSTGAAERQAEVLGVKMSGNRVPPTYVEGAGVILTTGAGFPIMPGDDGATTRPDRERQRPSAWDRAKREVKGSSRHDPWFGEGPEMAVDFAPAVEYDQAKVDALVDAIVKILPEAANFRHLKENEFVFVTVVGASELSVPARLTLKAKKADIDAASKGAITPDEFKSRVTSRVSVAATAGQSSANPMSVKFRQAPR